MRKRKRDSCEICRKADRNPTGHIDVYCAFPGGPFEGRLDAARKARQEQVKREKDRLKGQQASNEIVDNEGLLSERIDKVDEQIKGQKVVTTHERNRIDELARRVQELEARSAY